MSIEESIKNIRKLIAQNSQDVKIFEKRIDLPNFFKKIDIRVGLDENKEIILQEETKLEIGGVNKESFSLICPIKESDYNEDGKITLIGPEAKDISELTIDFGVLILIGAKKINNKDFENLRQFSLISNGIEGFLIRTIPRRFWCRIGSKVIKKFSFEFLGNAIFYLYKQKFGKLINSMEVLFITCSPDLIVELSQITLNIQEKIKSKWNEKILEWKKKVDCEYDWECGSCPYYDTCEEIKDVVDARKIIEN